MEPLYDELTEYLINRSEFKRICEMQYREFMKVNFPMYRFDKNNHLKALGQPMRRFKQEERARNMINLGPIGIFNYCRRQVKLNAAKIRKQYKRVKRVVPDRN